MTAPSVLNWHHLDETPPDAVMVGRSSKWGNPFHIGPDGSRATVIRKYRAYLLANPVLLAAARTELRGRTLVCYCKPKPCHGDVLLEIANESLDSL